MSRKIIITLSGIIILAGVLSFCITTDIKIPKVWDEEKLHSMHVPLPDTSMVMSPLPEEYYNRLPERVSYKSYPFYMPGMEPAGYYEKLRQLDPKIIFTASDLKTDADWIKAGEIVYEMPQVYTVMDSNFMRMLPELEKHWRRMQFPVTKDGIIPFLSVVVREKGRVELGTLSCGMCHNKLMPDGKLIKGAQGNFIFPRYLASILHVQRDFLKDPDSLMRARINLGNRSLFGAPWVHHESQERFKKMGIDEYINAFETPAAVLTRQGSGWGYPVAIPDLFNLKQRKYFDHTGQIRQRDIGDLMRYAILNQNLDFLHDYKGFTPLPRPVDPKKGNFTRFTDEQLYALSKYIYALKTPKNPVTYPKNILARGEYLFHQEGCITCHTPPFYSNNMLTPVDGFEPPKEHIEKYDVFNISVGTDPGLALYTRRGTGYYKIPSLIGVWNRTAFLHSGYLATLEDMFDPKRLDSNYVPSHYKPAWVKTMAVKGHPFAMKLNKEDKYALVAFLKSL